MVGSDLLQAAGRARLNVKDNKTLIVFSAQYLTGYTERSRFFEHIDLECVESIDQLDDLCKFKVKFDEWIKEEMDRRKTEVEGLISSGKSEGQIKRILPYPKSVVDDLIRTTKDQ